MIVSFPSTIRTKIRLKWIEIREIFNSNRIHCVVN